MKKRSLNLKTQAILLIITILSLILVVQLFFYANFRNWGYQAQDSIFSLVFEHTITAIRKLHEDVADIGVSISANSYIQDSIFRYSTEQKVKSMSEIGQLMEYMGSKNKSIRYFAIAEKGKLSFSSSFESEISLYNLAVDVLSDAMTKFSENTFTASYLYEGTIYFAHVCKIFPIDISLANKSLHDYTIIIYSLDEFDFLSGNMIDKNTFNVIICDQDDYVLFSKNILDYGKKLESLVFPKHMLQKVDFTSNPVWKIIISIPTENVLSLKTTSQVLIALIIVLNITVLFSLTRILIQSIIKRILIIKKGIEKIAVSNMNYRVEYEYNDEFANIITGINNMLDNINKLNQTQMKIKDELHNAQLLQKKTQIFYLQGQVSPHFLYNSMMHIQGAALKNNVTEIVNMTHSLSKVFRYFSSNVTISTIKQDLDVAIDYFNVINMRRANPVGINYDMDAETLNTQIIKMVFQPILENILKHAFSSGESGTLSISSKPPEGGYSIVKIQDNGKGIPSDKLEEIKKSLNENTFLSAYNQTENVGLLNVHTRLKMYYGPECGITIDSRLDYGTTVWVKVKSHSTGEQIHER